MRRVEAAIVLLVATVLLLFATPHHSTTVPGVVSTMAPAVEPEARKPHGLASALSHASVGREHHKATTYALARPSRAAKPLAEPTVLDNAMSDRTVDACAALGAAQPRTARDAWNPGAGVTPTPSTLGTFRC